jgi:hypothetical protein
VQVALLEGLREESQRRRIRWVLIHGVNPFGFAHLRRFNEHNVDLNRNFLNGPEEIKGDADDYRGLDHFLNPPSPPSRFEPFALKAIWNIWQAGRRGKGAAAGDDGSSGFGSRWRRGYHALAAAVAGGQYEFPRGLFYGGDGPCRSTQLIQEHCDAWFGSSSKILHFDFHTGLGRFGSYKMLLTETSKSPSYPWFVETFGAANIEPLDDPDDPEAAVAYPVSGVFGEWMQNHFNSRDYRFAAAEFGTYGGIRVLGALRAENRAHHYTSENSASWRRAKKELLECFCPKKPRWRREVVESSLAIIDQGVRGLEALGSGGS